MIFLIDNHKMAAHQKYVSSIQFYDNAIEDMAARIQQDRSLHMHDLTSIYTNAVSTRLPPAYLTMMESVIGNRSIYNDRKLVMDAADLSVNESKIRNAMGANFTALAGGSINNATYDGLKGLHYSAQRCNALLSNFQQKLAHDRELHTMELKSVVDALPASSQAQTIASNLYNARLQSNNTRMMSDAKLWRSVETNVNQILGGGKAARRVLTHGVRDTLQGGASTTLYDMMKHLNTPAFKFSNPDAARLYTV